MTIANRSADAELEQPDAGADDPSGSYDDGDLQLLVAPREAWLTYVAQWPSGHSSHTCTCVVRAPRSAPGQYRFVEDDGLDGELYTDGAEARITLTKEPTCCGSGWPGWGLSERQLPERGPTRCMVVSRRADFFDGDGRRTRAYLQYGDWIDTIDARENGHRIARFTGPRTTTLGFLDENQLRCDKQ
jgi:hypothetical protein